MSVVVDTCVWSLALRWVTRLAHEAPRLQRYSDLTQLCLPEVDRADSLQQQVVRVSGQAHGRRQPPRLLVSEAAGKGVEGEWLAGGFTQ